MNTPHAVPIRLIPEDSSKDAHNARAVDELAAVKLQQQSLEVELAALPAVDMRRESIDAELQALRLKSLNLQRDVVVDVIARLQKCVQ